MNHDGTPTDCPECAIVGDQSALKITARDFVEIKKKLIEMDDYIDYLESILRAEKLI